MTEKKYTEKLFSYGTLQLKSVQLATFGRELTGTIDKLQGFTLSSLQINNPDVVAISEVASHPIAISAPESLQNEIAGMVFDITAEELAHADEYEVAEYKRVKTKLASGVDAWVYVGG